MDESERELWCKAWRLLVQHGDDVSRVIDSELQQAVQAGDRKTIDDWNWIARAVEQLAR